MSLYRRVEERLVGEEVSAAGFATLGTLSWCVAASHQAWWMAGGLGLSHFVRIIFRGSEMSSARSGSSIRGSIGLAVGLL